jgi:hypothetical protein
MDLRMAPSSTVVLPEYIHKQVRHTMDHWMILGNKYGRTNSALTSTLHNQRTTHYQLLARTYGPTVYTWMNPPI